MGLSLVPPRVWFHASLAIIGSTIMVYAFLQRWLKEKLYLGEVVASTAIGIIAGPHVGRLVNPYDVSHNPEAFYAVSGLVLAIQLVSAGLSLPLRFFEREWRSLAVLLGPVMILTWAIAFGFALACFHEQGVLKCLLVAACLTPTDPVLASSILQGKFAERHIPANLRNLLQAEAASNDGVALPYVYLPIVLLKNGLSTRVAIAKWFYQIWGYQVLLSVLLGILYGFVALFMFYIGVKHDLIDEPSFLAQVIGLALGSLGSIRVIGSDGVLAVFCATMSFSSREPTAEENRYDAINGIELIITISYFMYFGTLLPWSAWKAIGYGRLVGFALSAAFVRRVPVLLALAPWIPLLKEDGDNWRGIVAQALFGGFQGPMGVGALFYAALVHEEIEDEFTFHVVSFIVFSSVIIHGLTGAHLAKILSAYLRHNRPPGVGDHSSTDTSSHGPGSALTPAGLLDHSTEFVGGTVVPRVISFSKRFTHAAKAAVTSHNNLSTAPVDAGHANGDISTATNGTTPAVAANGELPRMLSFPRRTPRANLQWGASSGPPTPEPAAEHAPSVPIEAPLPAAEVGQLPTVVEGTRCVGSLTMT
eukprot:SM000034S12750  [mRNA]  locus=s34:496085:499213:- [translate_table: standard]